MPKLQVRSLYHREHIKKLRRLQRSSKSVLSEFFKQIRQLVRRDPYAGVGHGYPNLIRGFTCLHRPRPPGGVNLKALSSKFVNT